MENAKLGYTIGSVSHHTLTVAQGFFGPISPSRIFFKTGLETSSDLFLQVADHLETILLDDLYARNTTSHDTTLTILSRDHTATGETPRATSKNALAANGFLTTQLNDKPFFDMGFRTFGQRGQLDDLGGLEDFSFTNPAAKALGDSTGDSIDFSSARNEGPQALDTVPSAPPTLTLATKSDSGTSSLDLITNHNTLIIQGTGAEPGAEMTLFDGPDPAFSGILGTGTANADGTWSLAIDAPETDGTFTVYGTATDASGNESDVSAPLQITMDTQGSANIFVDPVTSDNAINSIESAQSIIEITGSVSGEAAAGDMVTATINGTSYQTTVTASKTFALEVATNDLLADQDFDLSVTGTDAAGNSFFASVTSTHFLAPTNIIAHNTMVGENSHAGDIITTLDAVDPDSNGPFTYAIFDDPDQKFDIVGNQVRLKAGANLDFEAQDTHNLTIEVTDHDGATHQETITFHVRNEFEGEVNQIDISAPSANPAENEVSISFSETYTAPVVFAFIATANGSDHVIARVTDVKATGFTLKLQEPQAEAGFAAGKDNNYADGIHTTETVNYLVLESGTWHLNSGEQFEVGAIDYNRLFSRSRRTSGSQENVTELGDANATDNYFTQVQTNNNDIDFLKTRQDIIKGDAYVGMEVYERNDRNTTHLSEDETIGYLKLPDIGPNVTWNGNLVEADNTARFINHDQKDTIDFENSYTAPPIVFAEMNDNFGSDASIMRGTGSVTSTSADVYIDEDNVRDSERNHTTESSVYAIFGAADDNLGDGVVAENVLPLYDNLGALQDFGSREIADLSLGDDLFLGGLIDVDGDNQINFDDIRDLEHQGDLTITDDGTDVTLTTSAGGVATLTGASSLSASPIDDVDDLAAVLNIITTPS